MKIEVQNLIFKELTNPQIRKIMIEMEKMAIAKEYAIKQHYMQNIETEFMEDFAEMIENSSWTNFLPTEYYHLNNLIR